MPGQPRVAGPTAVLERKREKNAKITLRVLCCCPASLSLLPSSALVPCKRACGACVRVCQGAAGFSLSFRCLAGMQPNSRAELARRTRCCCWFLLSALLLLLSHRRCSPIGSSTFYGSARPAASQQVSRFTHGAHCDLALQAPRHSISIPSTLRGSLAS